MRADCVFACLDRVTNMKRHMDEQKLQEEQEE